MYFFDSQSSLIVDQLPLAFLQTLKHHLYSYFVSINPAHPITLLAFLTSYLTHFLTGQSLTRKHSFPIFFFQLLSIYHSLQVLIFNSTARPRYPRFPQVNYQGFLGAEPFARAASPSFQYHLHSNCFFASASQ
jgi:hypothetical protein